MIRGLYCKKKLEIRCQSVSRRLSVYFLSRYFQIFGIFVGIDHHFTQDKTGFIIACLIYCQSLSAPRKANINRFRIETDFDDSLAILFFH